MIEFDTRIKFLKGVGETRAKLLEKLGIFSIGALLRYYPKRYEDWNTLTKVSDAKKYLYFIPLLLIVSVNLWNEACCTT